MTGEEVLPGIRAVGDRRLVGRVLARCSGEDTVMVCVIASTEISKVPGISAAGKTPELTFHTPAGDVELVYLDRIVNADDVPQNPVGAPSPAVITRAVLDLADIPFLVADAGVAVKPACPTVDLNGGVGRDFRRETAVPEDVFESLMDAGRILGRELSRDVGFLTVGESVPGGTTTAMAVMTAAGYETEGRFASSSHDAPHDVKERVVREGLRRAGVEPGDLTILEAIMEFGDPMMPAVLGMLEGSRVPVLLAGGTQMAPILAAAVEELGMDPGTVFVGTTKYVVEDPDSDVVDLMRQASPDGFVLFHADPGFATSKYKGLRLYEVGYVKEGVGAGGAQVAAALKTRGRIHPEDIVRECERVHEVWSEALG